MKFEYNIDLVWRLVNFSPVGRSGIGPEKRHFAEFRIFRSRLLICEVHEILSKIDSRKSKFRVQTDTPQAVKVIQVGPGGSRNFVLIRNWFPRAETTVGKVVKSYEK